MPTKRFGARYGRRTKKKFALIESQQRAKHKCPYCSKEGVKRLATGIWQCRKCDIKFAGKAYTI
jgi:large subunit ribosomal protein L37Ae